MTGRIIGWVSGGKAPVAARGRASRHADPDRFRKLDLRTDDGGRLVMTDARRLGRIRLQQEPAAEPPVSLLGRDPYLDGISGTWMRSTLARRSAPIKAVLLDQGVFAGVGNWIADEVLYQARIAPRRRACDLASAETGRLRSKLLAIVRHAVKVGADDGRFPKTWLFHYRWGKAKDAAVPGAGRIAFSTVGGRTSAYVPGVQK